MKKRTMKKILLLVIALTMGFALGRYQITTVHAAPAPVQATAPNYACPDFGGNGAQSQCAQYIVQVANGGRFGGGMKVVVLSVNSSPIDTSTLDVSVVGNGFPINFNSYFPGSLSNTWTANLSQP